ncbi:unnamed protein product [Heterobilharzia americana]|nr:unnamed protein product [Heterobilharzia americana]CAH8611953.1 unnamed protein product [Heterobilharzia americana]
MIHSSTDMKLPFMNRSTQVAEILPTCLVDAQSYTHQRNENTTEILNQLETYKNTTFINLDNIQLTENTVLDQLIKESFTCSICQGLLVRARLLSCGHQFCRECLYYWFKIRHTCPLCRTRVYTNVPARHVDNFLDELIDQCYSEELKHQRKGRKFESTSELLDSRYDQMGSGDILRTVTESFVQTASYVDSTQSNV